VEGIYREGKKTVRERKQYGKERKGMEGE